MARGTASRRYYPTTVPAGLPPELTEWLRRELSAIFQGQSTILDLDVATEPPAHFREGMLRYADGVQWNPGAGKGVYVYNGTAWTKL
jgi:hypothetical protein